MWKLLIIAAFAYVIYMHGYDKGLPERRQLEKLQGQVERLEQQAHATTRYLNERDAVLQKPEMRPTEKPAAQ